MSFVDARVIRQRMERKDRRMARELRAKIAAKTPEISGSIGTKQKGQPKLTPLPGPARGLATHNTEVHMTDRKPTTAVPLSDLYPADTPAYMLDAWLCSISWSLGVPEVLAEFRADTGNNWQPASSPIEEMIDRATGVDRDFIEAFIKWHNVNIWGPIDGPDLDDAEAVR